MNSGDNGKGPVPHPTPRREVPPNLGRSSPTTSRKKKKNQWAYTKQG